MTSEDAGQPFRHAGLCPPADVWVELLEVDSENRAHHEVHEHLAQCDECQELIAVLARSSLLQSSSGSRFANGSERLFHRGARVGRYWVLNTLGQGTMGVVYAAYDPVLERRVALKVLRRVGGDGSERQQSQLVHEARCLASLSHPNVVRVYDVGTFESRRFVAQQLVDGRTLSHWLSSGRRSLDELLRAFVQLARGLFAVHEAGLVHCDVKPSNVLIDGEGAIRLADFGLARTADDPCCEGRVGTPAYMAPEVQAGRAPTQASDQYSYGRVLLEALDPSGFLKNDGRVPSHYDGHVLPAMWVEVLRRGLAPKPEDRWRSMAEIERRLAMPSRRRTGAWILAATVVGGVLVGSPERATPNPRTRCADTAHREYAAVWNPNRGRELLQTLGETDDASTGVGTRIGTRLDDFGERWRRQRVAVCLDDRPDAAQKSSRSRCVDAALSRVRELVDVLMGADAPAAARALASVDALPRVERCATATSSRGGRVEASLLDRAIAHHTAGHDMEALGLLHELQATLRPSEEPWLVAAVLEAKARTLRALGTYDEAREAGWDAFHLAQRAGEDELAARVAFELARLEASQLRDPQAARRAMEFGQAATRRLGDPPDLVARGHEARGVCDLFSGNPAEALPALRTAIDSYRSLDPVDPLQVALARGNFGSALQQFGQFEEARREQEAALEQLADALGPEHPKVATLHANLANTLLAIDELERSEEHHRRALEIRRRVLGPRHPDVGVSLYGLAQTLLGAGQLEQAEQTIDACLALRAELFGENSEPYALAVGLKAAVAYARGDNQKALQRWYESLTILQAIRGAGHRTLDAPLNNIAETLINLGRYAEAIETLEQVLQAQRRGNRTEHPRHLRISMNLGIAQVEAGRHAEARDTLMRVLAELQAGLNEPDVQSYLVVVEFGLARGWEATDPREALRRARSAATWLRKLDDPGLVPDRIQTRLGRWLAERGDLHRSW